MPEEARKASDLIFHKISCAGDFPEWAPRERLVRFFNENMQPYHDTVPDIESALEYALDPSREGFIMAVRDEGELLGALTMLDSIQERFPAHQINDDILFARADIMRKRNNYEAADSLLALIVERYPQGVLADEALFQRAQMHHHYFEQHDKAMALYQQLLLDYPGSLHTITARARFRLLRGDMVN